MHEGQRFEWKRRRGRALATSLALLLALLAAHPAGAVECWRGWGYFLDPQTGGYASEELLLVTGGAVAWTPGKVVNLYILNRQTGLIDPDIAPLQAVPLAPRVYFRGRANYVDGTADLAGRPQRLTFGLSHIPQPSTAIFPHEEFNRSICGLPPTTPQ